MLFYSYFKTLVGKDVTVELKNDLAITGTLHSVDQYLNVKLTNIRVVNATKYPHMVPPAQLSPTLTSAFAAFFEDTETSGACCSCFEARYGSGCND